MKWIQLLLFVMVFYLSSCSRKPKINCEPGNFSKLLKTAVKFIDKETNSDKKSEHLIFEKMAFTQNSCKFNRGKETVNFKIAGQAHDGGKIKPVRFFCTFGKIWKGKDDITCQLQ